MTAGLIALAAAVTALAGNFDCQIDQVAAVSVDAGKASASMIEGLPSEALAFRMRFDKDLVTVEWPNSPIQANGRQPAIPTGPDAGAVLMIDAGPCLFTETSCASMFNYARQPDGSLKLLITPTALSSDRENKLRFPFLVSMTGSCTPGASSK